MPPGIMALCYGNKIVLLFITQKAIMPPERIVYPSFISSVALKAVAATFYFKRVSSLQRHKLLQL